MPQKADCDPGGAKIFFFFSGGGAPGGGGGFLPFRGNFFGGGICRSFDRIMALRIEISGPMMVDLLRQSLRPHDQQGFRTWGRRLWKNALSAIDCRGVMNSIATGNTPP